MSAIAGILNFRGAPVEPGLIGKLTAAMRSCGPDEQTDWLQGAVALGHCMLRNTPESRAEHQPLASPDGRLVLVWDGRLDNRETLRRELLAGGCVLRDISDAEMALHAYALWGETCPGRLLGDFAFAVWDAGRKRLFCARDHMGARPFYYARNDHFFAFASEEEALPNLPGVSHEPDAEQIAGVLAPAFLDEDCESSWLRDVRTLPPARWLAISADGDVRSETYWQLQPGDEAEYASDEACLEAFLDVFGEAVRCRMRSTGDIAAMMSGGLDSASIAAMVRRILPEMPGRQFLAYSAIADHPQDCVESQCILDLTRDLGDRAHTVSVPSFAGMLDVNDLIETAWSKPHPVDNSILLPGMMCLAASRDGHRVMLHGMGGDYTTHAPNRYIAHLLRAGQWRSAWQECRAASRNNTYLQGTSPALTLMQNALAAYAPPGSRRLLRSLRSLRAGSPLVQGLLDPEYAKRLAPIQRSRSRARSAGPGFPSLQQAHIRAMQPPNGYVLGLNGYNRVAGRFGIELRDPWSDKRVAEFWLRLPLRYKVRNGWTKYLVRTGFANELPARVLWRTGKEHLGWHFAARLMAETRDLVERTLDQDLHLLAPYVDTEAVRALHARSRAAEGNEERQNLFEVLTLVLWLKRLSC